MAAAVTSLAQKTAFLQKFRFLGLIFDRINCPRSVVEYDGAKTGIKGVHGGKEHAIIRRQSAYVDGRNITVVQEAGKPRGLSSPIVKETAVAINFDIHAFAKNSLDPLGIQGLAQCCTGRTLHAVIGPEGLGQSVEIDKFVGLPSRMRRRETLMSSRMPILRGYHQVIVSLDAVNDVDYLPTMWDSQRPSG